MFYDVIIVGGGPAGSTAGIVLSKAGFNVLILDKAKFPRDKLCGGALTFKTELLLKKIGIFDYDSIIDYKTKEYGIFWKTREIFKGKSDYNFLFVKRKVYDFFLLEKAREKGAKVLENQKVIDIDFSKKTIITSSGKSFRYKYLIGADGVNSIVRKLAEKQGLIKNLRWKENLANAIEIYIDRKFLKNKIDYPYIILGYVNWGYSWIFPNKNQVVLGIGGLISKNKDLSKKFYSFLNDFISDYKPDKILGHTIPFGNYIRKPVFKNILLVGDAGGITNPASGEGIYSAQKSGELAGVSIIQAEKNKKDLEKTYTYLLNNFVYKEFDRDQKIRNIAYPLSNPFFTKWIFNLFSKKLEKIIHL